MADTVHPRPDLSYIIAAYNAEDTIERAIRSALEQTKVDVEVIVVDDCSSDETISVVAGIHDKRITLIRQAHNLGPSAARNVALLSAMGSWIAVLDADDAIKTNRSELCLRRATEFRADIVVDNLEIWRLGKRQKNMYPPHIFEGSAILTLAEFVRGNSNLLGGVSLGYLKPIFRSDFLRIENLRYDPEIGIGEDYVLLAEALSAGAKCAKEPTAGYMYTVGEISFSRRILAKDIQRLQMADRKLLARGRLDKRAEEALASRFRTLEKARQFSEIVELIKSRQVLASIRAILRHPISALGLWRPLWAKLGSFTRI